MKKTVLLSVVAMTTANLFGVDVQLPFIQDKKYICKQNSGGKTSHKFDATKYDLDFGLPRNTFVLAAANGEVVRVKKGCGEGFFGNKCGRKWGNHVLLKHSDGNQTIYAHLAYVFVKKGDSVRVGQPIGFSGNSGSSTGAHLHFGVHSSPAFSIPMKMYASEYKVNGEHVKTGWFKTAPTPRESDFTVGRYYKSVPMTGSDFFQTNCQFTPNKKDFYCFTGIDSDDNKSYFAFCDVADHYAFYRAKGNSYVLEDMDIHQGRDMCDECGDGKCGDYLGLNLEEGGGSGVGGGSGEETGLADGNIKKVEINGRHSVRLYPGEKFSLKVDINNKGKAVYEDAQVYVYLTDDKGADLRGNNPLKKDKNEVSDLDPNERKTVHLSGFIYKNKLTFNTK